MHAGTDDDVGGGGGGVFCASVCETRAPRKPRGVDTRKPFKRRSDRSGVGRPKSRVSAIVFIAAPSPVAKFFDKKIFFFFSVFTETPSPLACDQRRNSWYSYSRQILRSERGARHGVCARDDVDD